MSKDATEQLALVNSHLTSSELHIEKPIQLYRVGPSLPNLDSDATYRQALIREITFVTAPSEPMDINDELLSQFFIKNFPLKGAQSYFNGGVGYHNNQPYFRSLQLGAHWLYGATDKKAKLYGDITVDDEEIDTNDISIVREQNIPVQQSITVHQLPSIELAKLWADVIAIPNHAALFRNFHPTYLDETQVRDIHEGRDPFEDLKRKIAPFKKS
jgi:hypothetical protein